MKLLKRALFPVQFSTLKLAGKSFFKKERNNKSPEAVKYTAISIVALSHRSLLKTTKKKYTGFNPPWSTSSLHEF